MSEMIAMKKAILSKVNSERWPLALRPKLLSMLYLVYLIWLPGARSPAS